MARVLKVPFFSSKVGPLSNLNLNEFNPHTRKSLVKGERFIRGEWGSHCLCDIEFSLQPVLYRQAHVPLWHGQCDQRLKLKVAKNFRNVVQKSVHSSFYLKSDIFKITQNVTINLGYFRDRFCHQKHSKMAQSGQTGHGVSSQPVLVLQSTFKSSFKGTQWITVGWPMTRAVRCCN